MIPAPFNYATPKTLDEALTLLTQTDGARVIAGGQELLTELKLHRIVSPLLVDLRQIPGLRNVGRHPGEDTLSLGALTTGMELAEHPEVRAKAQALAEAAKSMGDAQSRNRGTLGGNLAFGSPRADLPAALLVLNASIYVVGPKGPNIMPAHRQPLWWQPGWEPTGPKGHRAIPIDQFFLGHAQTDLRVGEIITEVKLPPVPETSGSAYEKVKIPSSGYPLCGVAAYVEWAKNGSVTTCRVAVTGVSAYPTRLRAVEAALVGQKPTTQNIMAAIKHASEGVTFFSDLFGSADYRANLTSVLSERALTRAVERSATS